MQMIRAIGMGGGATRDIPYDCVILDPSNPDTAFPQSEFPIIVMDAEDIVADRKEFLIKFPEKVTGMEERFLRTYLGFLDYRFEQVNAVSSLSFMRMKFYMVMVDFEVGAATYNWVQGLSLSELVVVPEDTITRSGFYGLKMDGGLQDVGRNNVSGSCLDKDAKGLYMQFQTYPEVDNDELTVKIDDLVVSYAPEDGDYTTW